MEHINKESIEDKKEIHKKKMREYQYKKYHENKKLAQNISSIKYYKRKGLIELDDKNKYGDCIHFVAKAKKTLNSFKDKDFKILTLFLNEYLSSIQNENI